MYNEIHQQTRNQVSQHDLVLSDEVASLTVDTEEVGTVHLKRLYSRSL